MLVQILTLQVRHRHGLGRALLTAAGTGLGAPAT